MTEKAVSLAAALSKQSTFKKFKMWIVGDTPLITHAWSQKAKQEMLSKQVKATKPGREARDPERDFTDSLYEMETPEGVTVDGKSFAKGAFGFPVTGVKNCILAAAHKDKGIARTGVQSALYLDAEMWRARPALAGAICDMPLVRIYGSDPEMREDMVRIGAGMAKTANLAYRAQFTIWAMRITGEYNSTVITDEALAFLVNESGRSCGIGEWRNEKKGVFGSFHLAPIAEEKLWDRFAAGKGKMPIPERYNLPVAAE